MVFPIPETLILILEFHSLRLSRVPNSWHTKLSRITKQAAIGFSREIAGNLPGRRPAGTAKAGFAAPRRKTSRKGTAALASKIGIGKYDERDMMRRISPLSRTIRQDIGLTTSIR
jgi:hypothetical protein